MSQVSPAIDKMSGGERRRTPPLIRLLVAWLVLGALWVILAGLEDPTSWVVGLPAILAAAWSYSRLSDSGSQWLSIPGGIQLLALFFWESFKGGIDVAGRVVSPRLNVDPGFFDYRFGLELPLAQVVFVDLISLLPGTLSADLQGDCVRVHALDRGSDVNADLMRLERRIADLFGESLHDRTRPTS